MKINMHFSKGVLSWLLIVAILIFSGCEQTDSDNTVFIEEFSADSLRLTQDDLLDANSDNLTGAHHDFAFESFRSHASLDINTIRAPFDLQQLLSMVSIGAEGSTLDAFENVSRFVYNESTYEDISVWEQQVTEHVGIDRQQFLWGQVAYSFNETYLQTQAELFGPVITGLDFLTTNVATVRSSINDSLGGALTLSDISNRTRLVVALSTQVVTGWSPELSIEPVIGRFGEHYDQHWVDMMRVEGLLN